jgi:hypothetical protein
VGFPHSDIRGSTIARISPRLFAACHVLHRLLVPRHPPNALYCLILAFRHSHRSRDGRLFHMQRQTCSDQADVASTFEFSSRHDDQSAPTQASCPARMLANQSTYPLHNVTQRHPSRCSRRRINRRSKLNKKIQGTQTQRKPSWPSHLVEADGIEPTTPCLQSRCSPTELRPLARRQLATEKHGGPGKI